MNSNHKNNNEDNDNDDNGDSNGLTLGMTGTRNGISKSANITLNRIINRLINNKSKPLIEVAHGDCTGADADFHDYISENYNNIKIIIHPPSNNKDRAYKKGHIIMTPDTYLSRNRKIVDSNDILIGFPPTKNELPSSGTWYTIKYARKVKKGLIIIYPDGTFKTELIKEETLN